MSHVKRILWLAAWGVWLWLGVGLHRELPRELGPQVCKLAFEESEAPLGFLHSEDVVVSHLRRDDGDDSRFTLWNARTGSKLAERRGPWIEHSLEARSTVSMRHGVAVGKRPDDQAAKLRIFDLRTGEWRPLQGGVSRLLDFHPTKPWAAAAVGSDDGLERLVVFDLRTGAPVAQWPRPPSPGDCLESVEACRFRDDGSDELLIVVQRLDAERNVTQRFECWTVGAAPGAAPAPTNPDVHLDSPGAGTTPWRSPAITPRWTWAPMSPSSTPEPARR